jgi:capsular polysaccharide biosynthesis protein
MGFIILDPAELSFIEQESFSHAAKIIVAPIGAALANMIFARPECRILALSPYYKNANYFFYSNLAAALNLPFNYFLGTQSHNYGHPMHRSYIVNLDELRCALGRLI